MQEHTYKTYDFDELPAEAQQRAIDNLRDLNTDYNWWDCSFYDFKEIGKILGIEIDNIYFSGFASQGDGAQFTGSYKYAKGSAKAIRECAPKDKTLHNIADSLQGIQQRYFYGVTARVESTGRYSHAYDTSIYVYDNNNEMDAGADLEDEITEALRDLMHWMYRQLEREYYWLCDDEQIKETILCNEYQFTEDGKLN